MAMIKNYGSALSMMTSFAIFLSLLTLNSINHVGASVHDLMSSQRHLQDVGDFDRFNQLFQDATITIPNDFVITERVVIADLTLNISNIMCYNIAVGDISLSHSRISTTDIDVNVNITELDMLCDIDYQYTYGFLSGGGIARVTTDNNSASTTLKFQSENFDTFPPNSASVTECTANIEITNIEFFEDLASNIVELFERLIRDLIEEQVEGIACEELGSLGGTFVNDLLKLAETTLLGTEEDQELIEQAKNPLFIEQTTVLPDGVVPLNFLDKNSSIVMMFDRALAELNNYLGVMVDDPEGPKEDKRDLGINVLMRSSLLNENRVLVVDIEQLGISSVLYEGHDALTQTTISLNEVKVTGLDTLTRFNPLIPIGNRTLESELTWESLTLEVDVTLDIKPSTKEGAIVQDAKSSGITERINIDIGVDNIDVVAAIYLVIDQGKLDTVQLGSFLSLDNILPCLLSVVSDFQLSGLHVDPRAIDVPTMTGFVDPGIDRLIKDAVEAVFEMYGGVLEYAIPNVFQTTVRSGLNGLIGGLIEGGPCPVYSESDNTSFVDFREFFGIGPSGNGDIPSLLRGLLDSELLAVNPETSKPKINEVLVNPLTKSQSGVEGTLQFDGALFETSSRLNIGGLDATIQLRASDAKIENLDTISLPLALLEAVESEPYYLNNTATVGVSESPLRLSTKFFFSVAGDEDTQIKNELDISLDMESANIGVAAMMKVVESRLFGFPIGDVFDINCWLATIAAPSLNKQGVRVAGTDPTAALAEVGVSFAKMNLNISCVECSSPGMIEVAELLATKEGQDDAADVVNTLLDFGTRLLSENFLQVQIDRILNDAARKCPHSPTYDPNAMPIEYESLTIPESESNGSYLALVGIVALCLIFAVAFLVSTIKWIVRRRHRKWLATLPSEQTDRMQRLQRRQGLVEKELNEKSQSLFVSKQVPFILRWGMPVVILGNIALFLSGHLSLGATVQIQAAIAGEVIKVDEFYEFSIAKSTMEIWNSGGKALAVMILIFSVIWPYTKQLMTLAIWFTPPTRLSISSRGSTLLWLDWLGKWSFIDVLVLVITIAAFRVSIQSPPVAFLPDGFYSIDLLVVPLWGLYANMTAQLVSQISSHFIIHYHRRILEEATTSFRQRHELKVTGLNAMAPSTLALSAISDSDSKRLLPKHQYMRPHRGESEKLVVRNWVKYAVAFLGVSLVTLVILGCTMPSFSLSVLGLIGVAVEAGQGFEEADTDYSVITVVKLLMDEARFLNSSSAFVGLGTLSGLLVLTVLVVPVLQALALLRQWYSPLNMKERRRMTTLIEILQAWQYAEVYFIGVFISSWQLGPVSEFMVNTYCEALSGFFADLVFFGVIKGEDAQCFSVQSSIGPGSFLLVAGAVLLALLNTFVVKAATQYLRDKNELEKSIEDEKMSSFMIDEKMESTEGATPAKILPVPVLFTDTFRWCLRSDNRHHPSSRAFSVSFDVSKGDADVSQQDETDNLEVQYSSSGEREDIVDDGEIIAYPIPDGESLEDVEIGSTNEGYDDVRIA